MSDWSDYAREVQAAADSAGRRADTEMKGLKCKIEELEKACKEWAEVSQSNYQRAKAAEANQLQQALAMPEIKALVEALKLAEELYQLGLVFAPSGLADKVVSARQSALAAVGVTP